MDGKRGGPGGPAAAEERGNNVMKEKINAVDYACRITAGLSKGILLNTQADKFNTMVIGWGHLGRLWNKMTFVVYVRQSRFTKEQIEKNGSFTISCFMEEPDPKIFKVCGTQSGRDIDKVSEAGLTLEEAQVNGVPGIKEYPLTIECKVLYSQDQVLEKIPADSLDRFYAGEESSDYHTMYVGEIVDSYIIR